MVHVIQPVLGREIWPSKCKINHLILYMQDQLYSIHVGQLTKASILNITFYISTFATCKTYYMSSTYWSANRSFYIFFTDLL